MNVVHNLRQAVEWYRGFIEERLEVLQEERRLLWRDNERQIKEFEAALAVGKEIEEGKRKL